MSPRLQLLAPLAAVLAVVSTVPARAAEPPAEAGEEATTPEPSSEPTDEATADGPTLAPSPEPPSPAPSESATDDESWSASAASAPTLGTFGIGVELGQPVGVTAKVFLAPEHALQLGLGYDLVYLDAGVVTLDYVWHPTSIYGNSRFLFTWHVGVGASLGVWPVGHSYDCRDGDPLTEGVQAECRTAWVQPGARIPLGIEMVFRDVPLELFVEFAPGVIAWPEVEFLGQGGFGARWYL